jgi:hypothetical protein
VTSREAKEQMERCRKTLGTPECHRMEKIVMGLENSEKKN